MNTPLAISKISPPADVPRFERGLWNRVWVMILLCLVFVTLDWGFVPLQIFPVVFIFPVMLIAWNRSLFFSAICAGGLAFTRMVHQSFFSSHPFGVEELADTFICFFVLELLAALTAILGRQSRQLRHRVRVLEGMLPICSFCKSIRNDKDEWMQLEEYIAMHSAATFSHGLCPGCAEKHYGDIYKSKK